MIQLNIDITVSMCRTSIFSCDMTMISYYNIIIDIIIIANSALVEFLKFSFSSLVITSFFLMFFIT